MRPANLLFTAFLAYSPLLHAQDTTGSRPQADLAREADSIRAAYADSIARYEPTAGPEPTTSPAPSPAPAPQPAPDVAGQPDRAQIDQAIARGQKSKDFEGVSGGSATLMKQGRGFDVSLTGPLNRVANAARAAKSKYLTYTADSVRPQLVRPVVVVNAYPRKPQLMSGSWKQTPPATHLVLRRKDAPKGEVVQPTAITTFPEAWGNAFGAKFQGQGVRAEFPLSAIPKGEFDVLVITSDNEYKIGIDKKESRRLK